jgi:TolB-like protein/Flp pilus assembly protein TadD
MSSIIEGYSYDIFISYRQNDNKYDGWVTEFVDNLNKELEANIKDKVSVYFDINPHDGLLETHSVDRSLEDKLKCLIFIPITSRTYCDSKSFAWQHEFCTFNKLAKEDKFERDIRLSNGNVTSRILPVKIHDLDPDDKTLLENELGTVLRSVDFIYKSAGVNRPLRANEDHPQDNLNKTYYRDQINKVANAVKEIIASLIKQSKHQEEAAVQDIKENTRQKRNWKSGIIIGIIILAAFIIAGYFIIPKRFKSTEQLQKSIAVLPFHNYSGDPNQDYMSDGLTDEIIGHLYKIKSFDKVVSLSSVLTYKNTEKKTPQIADELKVNYILEGTYKKIGDMVRVTAQLIEPKNDKHLWQNEYDKPYKEITTIQADIAFQIAENIKAFITDTEKQNIQKIPTTNQEAYNLYLQGNYYYWKSYDSQDWEKAIVLYQKAIKIDPEFALAYTRLAMCHLQQYWFYHNRNIGMLQISKNYIDKATRLNPGLPEASLALGHYYYYGLLDYSKAIEHLEIVLKEQPGNSEALYCTGCVYRRAGNWDMAKTYLVKACELDPKSARIAFNTGQTFDLIRDYPEALKYFNLTLSINPDWTYPYRDLAYLYLKIYGNTSTAQKLLENEIQRNKSFLKDSLLIEEQILIAIYESRFDDALKKLTTSATSIFETQFYIRPKYLYYAFIYGLMNNHELEYTYYDSARILLEKKIMDFPSDQRLYSSLGVTYAGLGQSDKAIATCKKAIKMLPVEREAWKGVYLVEDLAYVYVKLRKFNEALEQIDYLLSIPGELSTKILLLDPKWAPLKDQPEFKNIIEKYSAK